MKKNSQMAFINNQQPHDVHLHCVKHAYNVNDKVTMMQDGADDNDFGILAHI